MLKISKLKNTKFKRRIQKLSSKPFYYSDYLFYQDKFNNLCKIPTSGQDLSCFFGVQISSSPFVEKEFVYFQEKDTNKLGKISINGGKTTYFNFQTQDSPYVNDNYIYFRDMGGYLCKCDINGKNYIRYNALANDTPVIYDKFIYFQSYNSKLYRQSFDEKLPFECLDVLSKTSPFIYSNKLYFYIENLGLFQSDLNGKNFINLTTIINNYYSKENLITPIENVGCPKSKPFVKDDCVYFQNLSNRLVSYSLTYKKPIIYSNYQIFSSPFITEDSAYFVGKKDNDFETNILIRLQLFDILDVWGEGRTDHSGLITGFIEAKNTNLLTQKVKVIKDGKLVENDIPNLYPIDDYNDEKKLKFPIENDKFTYITSMGSPINKTTANEMYRVLKKTPGSVIILYGQDASELSVFEQENLRMNRLKKVDYQLSTPFNQIKLSYNIYHVYANFNDNTYPVIRDTYKDEL